MNESGGTSDKTHSNCTAIHSNTQHNFKVKVSTAHGLTHHTQVYTKDARLPPLHLGRIRRWIIRPSCSFRCCTCFSKRFLRLTHHAISGVGPPSFAWRYSVKIQVNIQFVSNRMVCYSRLLHFLRPTFHCFSSRCKHSKRTDRAVSFANRVMLHFR